VIVPGWLLLFVLTLPSAYAAQAAGAHPLVVFVLAALALIPAAGLIAVATDALAERLGPTIGGLLNATFGNAAELIIGIFALASGLTDVVRASIAGSVIGNTLLVLGTAMVVGGWRHRLQRFDAQAAGHYAALLALSVVGLVVPTITATLGASSAAGADIPSAAADQLLSNVVAGLLLFAYVAYIGYSVFGIRAVRRPGVVEHVKGPLPVPESAAGEPPRTRQRSSPADAHDDESMGDPLPRWVPAPMHVGSSIVSALAWLGVATVLTALASELLVSSIEPVAHEVGLSRFFIGLIVLPVVGNAGEYYSAITQAVNNHMNATMAITAGSAIQITLLVAPLFVFLSIPLGHPLTLLFIPLELVIFALVALLYAVTGLDGESTWLEGLLLIVFYAIVAVSAFFVP
jgi:Ca2+:H+ antiporter